jgi:Xaa-Pro dipeptidase
MRSEKPAGTLRQAGVLIPIVERPEGATILLTRRPDLIQARQTSTIEDIRIWWDAEDANPARDLKAILEELGLAGGRIAVELNTHGLTGWNLWRLQKTLDGFCTLDNDDHMIRRLRLVKSPAELDHVRHASRLADGAMAAFDAALREGTTELALAGVVYGHLLANGSGIAASPINIVSGERSGFSHGAPTQRVLRRGDFGSVEFGATYRRYTATIGRQFCIGQPTARMRQLHDVVRRASDACIAAIRDGVRAVDAHDAARAVIVDAGLEAGRVHTSGYGLAPGCYADMVLLQARDPAEAIRLRATRLAVLRRGRMVAEQPPATARLSLAGRPTEVDFLHGPGARN